MEYFYKVSNLLKTLIIMIPLWFLGTTFALAESSPLSELKNKVVENSGINIDDGLSPLQESQVIDLLRAFLEQNPELLYESLQTGLKRSTTRGEQVTNSRDDETVVSLSDMQLSEHEMSILFNGTQDAVINPGNDEKRFVYFFDYACIHCKMYRFTIEQILEEHPNAQFVFKEFPILGPDSQWASKVGLYLAEQNTEHHYLYYQLLMKNEGLPNSEVIDELLKAMGYNAELAKQEIKEKETQYQDYIDETLNLARSLGIRGTPAIIAGDTLFKKKAELIELENAL